MVDPDVLSARLDALEAYLRELRKFRAHAREAFVRDQRIHHLAERYLHLACECVLDITHHIIADQGYRQPKSYRDAIEVLREQGLIDQELSKRLQEWMGFRNVLVHFYLAIDHGRAYDAIAQDLEDLASFARCVSTLLDDGDEHPGSS